MKKHCTFGKKSLVIAVEMLSVLGIIGIICFLFTRCIIVTDNKNYSFLINPFEDKEYEESEGLAEMFDSDSADMIYYLALCQQFETNGEFDKEKTIDLVEYYYRKQPESVKVSGKGSFEYKVQDLINWGNTYGVDISDGIVEEKYYPVNGKSVYESDIVNILDEALPNGISGFERLEADSTGDITMTSESAANIAYDETAETVSKETEDGEENAELEDGEANEAIITDTEYKFASEMEAMEYAMLVLDYDVDSLSMDACRKGMAAVEYLDEMGYLSEGYLEEIGISIQKEFGYEGNEKEYLYEVWCNAALTLLESSDYVSQALAAYAEILSSVISDLTINYERYQDYKDYFVVNKLNFKYLYLPDKNEDYYSNLEIKNVKQAQNMTEFFNDQLAAWVVIEPATKNVVERSSNVTVNSLLPMLDTVGYSFRQGGGTIYLGVLKEDIAEFADYDKSDHYATAQRAYDNFRSEFRIYLILVGVLVVTAVVSFVLYSCMCGNRAWYEVVQQDGVERKKLAVSDNPSLIKYFDRWFTEIAFGVGIGALAVMVIGFAVVACWLLESENVLYIIKNQLVLVAVLVYAGIFNGICLFLYGSLVRRIKTKTLWSGSLCALLIKAIKKLFHKIKEFLVAVYYNRGIVFRICLFYIPLILVGILLIMFGTAFLCDGDRDMGILLYLMTFVLVNVVLYFVFRNHIKRQEIIEGIEKINGGEFGFQINTTQLKGDNLRLAEAVNHIGTGINQAVETSMKDERLKADLITNVSHDIKTPLTSIINYVDLLKRENVQDETLREYIEVLDVKSQRLKQLTDDLVEASKISSGNITLVFEKLHVTELVNQMIGEFSEKFQEKQLDVITNFMDKDAVILADGRRMWRVFENLFVNIYKYAMPGTRVYLEVYMLSKKVHITIKNISKQPLNIEAEELTERFIRGDISRSTEGSGLGLSIAKNLVIAQKGEFKIYLDGDLFKVTIVFSQETGETEPKQQEV